MSRLKQSYLTILQHVFSAGVRHVPGEELHQHAGKKQLADAHTVCTSSSRCWVFRIPGYFKLCQMLNWHSPGFQSRKVKMASPPHIFTSSTAENMILFWVVFQCHPSWSSNLRLLHPTQCIPLIITTLCFQSLKETTAHYLKTPLCGKISRLSCAVGRDGDAPDSIATVGSSRKSVISPLWRGRRNLVLSIRSKGEAEGWLNNPVHWLKKSPLTGAVEDSPRSDRIVHLSLGELFNIISPAAGLCSFPSACLPSSLPPSTPPPPRHPNASVLYWLHLYNQITCKSLACTGCSLSQSL